MRLLNVGELYFKPFPKKAPPYAILSHRWGENEPSLADIEQKRDCPKVRGFADYVKAHFPQLEWIWVDSCCINQDSAAELSEGVNCMFEWYRDSRICVAYLQDVEHPSDVVAFRKSVWFKRGWTLQELLASTVVLFVTNTWQIIGHKGNAGHLRDRVDVGHNLEALIAEVTDIPHDVLQDFSNSYALDVEERISWMVGRRETLRPEDEFYALFGIFGVTPGANYGEKRAGAERRLRTAIAQKQGKDTEPIAMPSRPPRHSIPFRRDPAFVKREEISIIGQKLSQPGARVVVAGLGGIGKSQLAIEQCYRTMDDTSQKSVFWLHASSAARFDQEVTALLQKMNVIGYQEKHTDIYQRIRGWLNDPDRPWLLVLDNADDANFLFDPPDSRGDAMSRDARIDFLPTCSHGSLLVTTRREAIARRLTDEQDIITLGPESEMAIELLRSKLGVSELTPSVAKLAAALDYIPLALAQAAAYISQRSPRCTIEDYITKLDESDRSKSKLMKLQSSELRRDRREAENSILLTWQISFQHIRRLRPSAADLLSIMSFYNHQRIPDILLKSDLNNENDTDEPPGSNSDNDTDDALEKDITVLRDYSFVSAVLDGSTLRMHRLVQLSAQVWLQEHSDQYEYFQSQSIQRLYHAYPEPDYEHWARCRTLQPHAKQLCEFDAKDDDDLLTLASIGYNAAWFALKQGFYSDAEDLITRTLHDRQRIHGFEHESTLSSMDILAVVYKDQGRSDDAVKLGVKVMESSRNLLGEDHPLTIASMSNLAVTYRKQGRLQDAETLDSKVLEARRRRLGDEHSDTLMSMNNLAAIYIDQGRLKEAEQLQNEVFESSKRSLGEEHPKTLRSMYNLAETYSRQGRLKEAEELEAKVVRNRKKVLGPEHPDTLDSMHNLAVTYCGHERWEEAEQLFGEVLEARKRVLGEEHADTLKTMYNLALTYYEQGGRLKEAEELGVKLVELSEKVLGQEHPNTLGSMQLLANTYYMQGGRLKEAEDLGVKVVELCRTVLGQEHPNTLHSMHNLALIYYKQDGRLKDAEELGVEVVELRRKVIGQEHPDTLDSMHNLALIYYKQDGRLKEAEELGVEVVELRRKVLGGEHVDTLSSMYHLARL